MLPATRHKWTHPALIPAKGRYSIYLPRRDGRLSWPRWLVTYRDGLLAHRQSPIQVLTRELNSQPVDHKSDTLTTQAIWGLGLCVNCVKLFDEWMTVMNALKLSGIRVGPIGPRIQWTNVSLFKCTWTQKYIGRPKKKSLLPKKVKRLRSRHLQGNLNSSGLQFALTYWPALAVSGAAQLAAAHCPNERTLDPQSAARQTHLCPSQPQYGLHPATFSGNDSLFWVASITNSYSFTYLGGMKGWVGPSITSVSNLPRRKYIKQQSQIACEKFMKSRRFVMFFL